MSYHSLVAMFLDVASREPSQPALAAKAAGEYQSLSYGDAAEQVRRVGASLVALGLRAGDRVALFVENRPEWALADLGIYAAGGVVVPIYGTLTAPQVEYILRDAGARVLVVSDPKRIEMALALRPRLPDLEQIVVVGEDARAGTVSFNDLVAGREASVAHRSESERRMAAARRSDLATIVYTSGTTGEPKGGMLTHGNVLANLESIEKIVVVDTNDVFLSFLPLSHIFERTAGHYLPLRGGATIYYAESIFTVAKNLEEARPTVLISVPRLYENIHQRVVDAASKSRPTQRRLFHWAYAVGLERARRRFKGRRAGPALAAQHAVANRLVLRRIQARLGGRIRYLVSGGAALSKETAEFFFAIGLPVLQGYGLTETSPVISVNRPERALPEGVGPAIEGVEVRIAEDGEICARGASIFRGYWNKPEETDAAIDDEGWFHTGDIGRMDADGHIYITDRKKNLLVLSTGKNVAPQPIEARLKTSPYISDCLLLGDRNPAVGALIVPSFEGLRTREEFETLEKEALLAEPAVRKLIRAEIDRLSEDLAEFERVKRFALLDREFSMDLGELTPTLKHRRAVILEHFADQVRDVCRG